MVEIEKKYLQEYDYLGDVAYLNCCFVAMQPKRTLEFCKTFQEDFVNTLGEKCYGVYEKQRKEVEKKLAELIHCKETEIQLTHNTTEGDCLLMNAYPFKPGDSVVVSDYDYPAMVYGWYQLTEKGIRIKKVKAVNGAVRAEDIIAAMDETTKVVSVSQVQYLSGYQTDLMKIGQACHERGILLAVDAIQGLGRNEIDVKKMHVSVLSCGAFKGLLGVFGAAFYYCSEEVIPHLSPNVWSEGNIAVSEEEFPVLDHQGVLPYKSGIERLTGGSLNTCGILAMGISVSLLLEIGISRIQEKVRELEGFYRHLLEQSGLPIELLGDRNPKTWSGNVCFTFPLEKVEAVERCLSETKIYATTRKICGQGFLRIGIHYYNNEEQLERLVTALKAAFKRSL